MNATVTNGASRSDNWVTVCALTLAFTQPWAIGEQASLDADVKQPVVRDPFSQTPVLPGSSIAGSLRDAAQSVLGQEDTEWLFGHVTQTVEAEGVTPSTAKAASVVEILGAVAQEVPQAEQRVRTAIDPKTGAAEVGMLRNEDIVQQARYRIVVKMAGALDSAQVEGWLEVLDKWSPQLGRGRSVGLGRGRVEKMEMVSANLNSDVGLEWWLFKKQQFFDAADNLPADIEGELRSETLTEFSPESPTTIKIEFRLAEPMHIGMAEKGQTGDVPLYRCFNAPTIPGTSWKGVLRHRVQTILNLVTSGDKDLIDQATHRLFGSSEQRGVLWLSNSEFTGPDGAEPKLGKREHVAIDRFSGGAKDTAKFTWDCVEPGNTTTLRITTTQFDEESELANLLRHAIRDLHDGIIGIGGGVSRGYGRIEATNSKAVVTRPIDIDRLKQELEKLP